MVGERAQDWVGLAVAVRVGGEVFVQAADGQSHRPDQVFRAALATHGVLFLEGGKFLPPKTFRKGGGEDFDAASFNPGMQITLRRLRVIYIP